MAVRRKHAGDLIGAREVNVLSRGERDLRELHVEGLEQSGLDGVNISAPGLDQSSQETDCTRVCYNSDAAVAPLGGVCQVGTESTEASRAGIPEISRVFYGKTGPYGIILEPIIPGGTGLVAFSGGPYTVSLVAEEEVSPGDYLMPQIFPREWKLEIGDYVFRAYSPSTGGEDNACLAGFFRGIAGRTKIARYSHWEMSRTNGGDWSWGGASVISSRNYIRAGALTESGAVFKFEWPTSFAHSILATDLSSEANASILYDGVSNYEIYGLSWYVRYGLILEDFDLDAISANDAMALDTGYLVTLFEGGASFWNRWGQTDVKVSRVGFSAGDNWNTTGQKISNRIEEAQCPTPAYGILIHPPVPRGSGGWPDIVPEVAAYYALVRMQSFHSAHREVFSCLLP